MKRSAPLLVFLLLISPVLSVAQDRCIRQTRYWGGDGPASTAVVLNDHAFFGGMTLRVADLTDPTKPEVVHDLRLAGYATDIDTHGDRVYVTDSTNELKVIDATDPSVARVEASFVPQDPYWNLLWIDIQGDLAAVGGRGDWSTPDTYSNLMFLDLSDPSIEPPLLGSLQLDGIVESIALGNHTAVATTRNDSIWFIDITDPTAPFIARELSVIDLIASGEARDLETYEDLLALADSAGRVTLIDISEPSGPEYESLIQGLDIGVPDLEFEGPMLHATGASCTSSGICGGYALVNCFAPRSPDLVGRVEGPLMASPAPHAGHVMAAGFEAGLRVVDLAGLTDPVVLDFAIPQRAAGAVAYSGPLVHVVNETSLADPEDPDRNTLEVLEQGQGGNLVEMSSYAPSGAIWALAGDGDYVVAAIYDEEIEFNSVEVIDVSDPSTPVMGTRLGAVLSVETDTMEPHLRMKGNRLYISLESSDDILIYEIAEGGRATQVGKASVDGELVNFAPPSDDVLVAAVRQGGTGWVNVIDVSTPSAPVLAARFDLPLPAEFAVSLDAEGSRMAVLAQANDGPEGPYNYATLVDITEPSNPVLLADKLAANRWVAMGSVILHGVVDRWFPPTNSHHALDVTDPGNVTEAENLGALDVYRNRVDRDGSAFAVSLLGRLEVHLYGICRPPMKPVDHPAVVE